MGKQTTYNYNLAARDLPLKCRQMIQLVKTDLEDFKRFGITTSDLDKFKKQIEDYEEYPDDSIFMDHVSLLIGNKTEIENKLLAQTREMFLHITMAVSKEEMKDSFKSQRTTNLKPQAIKDLAASIIRFVASHKNDMAKSGIKAADINAYKALAKNYRDIITDIEDARKERLFRTAERRQKSENIYEQLVKYSTIGKSISKNKNDDAQYKRYLLYYEAKTKAEKTKNKNKEINNLEKKSKKN